MVLFEPENKLSVDLNFPALDTEVEPAPRCCKTKSESGGDELDKRRTEKQTKWAVRIFQVSLISCYLT